MAGGGCLIVRLYDWIIRGRWVIRKVVCARLPGWSEQEQEDSLLAVEGCLCVWAGKCVCSWMSLLPANSTNPFCASARFQILNTVVVEWRKLQPLDGTECVLQMWSPFDERMHSSSKLNYFLYILFLHQHTTSCIVSCTSDHLGPSLPHMMTSPIQNSTI